MSQIPIVYTIQQYTALAAAIAEGVTSVHYGDKTVQYRSLDDMLRILALMKRQLFPCSDGNNGRKFASFSKGTTPRKKYRF